MLTSEPTGATVIHLPSGHKLGRTPLPVREYLRNREGQPLRVCLRYRGFLPGSITIDAAEKQSVYHVKLRSFNDAVAASSLKKEDACVPVVE